MKYNIIKIFNMIDEKYFKKANKIKDLIGTIKYQYDIYLKRKNMILSLTKQQQLSGKQEKDLAQMIKTNTVGDVSTVLELLNDLYTYDEKSFYKFVLKLYPEIGDFIIEYGDLNGLKDTYESIISEKQQRSIKSDKTNRIRYKYRNKRIRLEKKYKEKLDKINKKCRDEIININHNPRDFIESWEELKEEHEEHEESQYKNPKIYWQKYWHESQYKIPKKYPKKYWHELNPFAYNDQCKTCIERQKEYSFNKIQEKFKHLKQSKDTNPFRKLEIQYVNDLFILDHKVEEKEEEEEKREEEKEEDNYESDNDDWDILEEIEI
jgi:hypothetical protein